MRPRFPVCMLALMLALLIPLGAQAETRIMVATDLHYISPSLYGDSELFRQALLYGDGKAADRSPELLEALVAEALHQRPDALILTGDLTLNGERRSHLELAAAMDRLWDEGIPVYVIPGNHDINNPGAIAFSSYAYAPTENVTPAEFRAIWARCLPPAETPRGMSCTVRLSPEVWLAMTDVCVYEEAFEALGRFTDVQADWLTGVLEEAREAGAAVVTATHQNLLPQTPFRADSYTMVNGEGMAAILRAGGVRLNLSGHIHVQHTVWSEGLTDAATGAFSVSPHRWGLVTVTEDGQVRYEARVVCEEHLPAGFREETAAFFARVTAGKLSGSLSGAGLTDEAYRAMLNYAVRFNSAYFGGTLDPADPFWREDPGYALWADRRETLPFGGYMLRCLEWEEARQAAE